eukprot:2128300-Pyramimonas_sp.AAC.2
MGGGTPREGAPNQVPRDSLDALDRTRNVHSQPAAENASEVIWARALDQGAMGHPLRLEALHSTALLAWSKGRAPWGTSAFDPASSANRQETTSGPPRGAPLGYPQGSKRDTLRSGWRSPPPRGKPAFVDLL